MKQKLSRWRPTIRTIGTGVVSSMVRNGRGCWCLADEADELVASVSSRHPPALTWTTVVPPPDHEYYWVRCTDWSGSQVSTITEARDIHSSPGLLQEFAGPIPMPPGGMSVERAQLKLLARMEGREE